MVSARKILFGFLVQSRARPTFLFLFNSFSQLDLGDDGVCVVNSLFIRKSWTIFLPKDVFFSLRTCILLASAFRVQCEKEYKSVFFLLLFFWRISFVFAFHLLFVFFLLLYAYFARFAATLSFRKKQHTEWCEQNLYRTHLFVAWEGKNTTHKRLNRIEEQEEGRKSSRWEKSSLKSKWSEKILNLKEIENENSYRMPTIKEITKRGEWETKKFIYIQYRAVEIWKRRNF